MRSTTSSSAEVSWRMSSRSIGVTNVEFSRWMMSWVIRSPVCSQMTMSRARSADSGYRPSIRSSRSAAWTALAAASSKRSKNSRSFGAKTWASRAMSARDGRRERGVKALSTSGHSPPEAGELLRRHRVAVLGARVPAAPHVVGEGRDAGDHLVLEVRVALDELRAEPLADAEQVVEDEHLPVDRRPGADADDGHVEALHEDLRHRGRDRLEDEREAPRLLQGERLRGDPLGRGGGAALGPVAAERRRRLRREPHVPHDRDAGPDDGAGAGHRGRAAALELHRVDAGLLDEAERRGDRLLVADLVGAEREVADEERGPQPAADGAGEDEQLLERDRHGGVVPEDRHGPGVAHQDEVDAG